IGLSTAELTARAQAVPETGSKRWKEEHARKLDDLFAALKRSNSPGEASSITSRIWSLWYESGNEDVDLLMRQSRQAFQQGEHRAAIGRVDQALRIEPRYSEAWNLRATIHFYMGDHDSSVADIQRTLALEPRHFGALAGLMMINMSAKDWAGALKSLRAALAVHPHMRERELVTRLEELVKGQEL
ncbi:MAG: tetratricopeptide repeat protein, partial [Hyphomicrobiaceae bacterium]